MERVWDISKKVAFGGAVLAAVPVLVPCFFVLSIAAAVLSVPVASTAVGYYALKKVVGFGKTRVLGWHSDTDRYEGHGTTFDQYEARGSKAEALLPPSSPVYVPSEEAECEIVPVSQEPTTDHQHDEVYDDREMVEGSAQVGLCAPRSAPDAEDAEGQRIGAEAAPEACEEKAVQMNVCEQPQVYVFVGSQNVERGEYRQDELVDKQEADEVQKEQIPPSDGAVELQDTANQEQQEPVGQVADAEGDESKQIDMQPQSSSTENEREQRKSTEEGLHDSEKVDKPLPEPHDAGKKRLASDVLSLTSQGEEKVPREENMRMHSKQVSEEGGEPLLEQSESLAPEAEEKEPGAHQLKLEAAEKEPGAEQLKTEAVEKEPGAHQLKHEAEEKEPEVDEKEPGARELKPEAEEKEPGVEQLKPEAEEKEPGAQKLIEENEPGAEQLKPEAEEKEPGAEQLKPEAEDKEPGPEPEAEEEEPEAEEKEPGVEQSEAEEKEPGAYQLNPEAEERALAEAEQLKPLLAPEVEEPEAEADGGAPDHMHEGEKDHEAYELVEPEAEHIHDKDLEPELERTGSSEQKPVEAGGDMQQTEHGTHDRDSEREGEPVVVELESPKPAGAANRSSDRSEQDTSNGYHRLDGASSMEDYASVAEDFPEDGVSSSDEAASRRFHSQELSRTSSARSEDNLLREILTVQKVVGYKDDLRDSPADEVERLYDFLGVEMPPAYENTTDPRKLLESLDLLKAIVGVK